MQLRTIVMSIPFEPEVIEQLRSAKRLQGRSATGGFAFDLDLSTPALAVAIHAGHNVREELLPLMQIPEKDRLFEEDPATDRMIQGNANAIWGLDSRAEYDLNRPRRRGPAAETGAVLGRAGLPRRPHGRHGASVPGEARGVLPVCRQLHPRPAGAFRFLRRLRHPLVQYFAPGRKGNRESSPVQSRNGAARSVALGQPDRCVAASARQDRNPGDRAPPWRKTGFFRARGSSAVA